jgi:hypothetical protein
MICHAQLTADDGRTRDLAVFAAYPKHVANLMVLKDDVDDYNAPYEKTGDYWCFLIKDHVTTSLGSGLAASRSLPEVPSLLDARVATGDRSPYDAARNREKSARYNAILDLPPRGNYSVYTKYEYQAFFGAEPFGCIAHTVSYAVDAKDPVKLDLGWNNYYVVVQPNAVFYMDNRSDPDTPQVPSHFLAYAKLFYGATNITAPTRSEETCPKFQSDAVYCGNYRDLDIDCSNSRFP